MAASSIAPWRDPAGRFSLLKLVVLLGLLAPAAWILALLWLGATGPRPVTFVIHETGLWAIRFLLVTLVVTPARRFLFWPRAFILRRLIGLAVLAYALGHFSFFIVDKAFDLRAVADELVLRYYLTIGLFALIFLITLGVTSTDASLRRMGTRDWRRLHTLIYPILVLAVIHFFMQSKLDVTQPTLLLGLSLWLVLYRGLDRWLGREGPPGPLSLLLLAWVTGGLTAILEALYYHLAVGAPLILVLRANLSLGPAGWRPALLVTLAGMALALLALLRRLFKRRSGRSRHSRPGHLSSGAERC